MPGKEDRHKGNLGMKVYKDNSLNANEILSSGVPENEESCEGNMGMEVETKSVEEEDGVLNEN